MVVVDNDGKSRLVACALVSRETTSDYEWILEQMKDACDHGAPVVIVVDEDPAMEAACQSVFPDTRLINCIWHLGTQNVKKNLRAAIGPDWDIFNNAFWRTRDAVTEQEFERGWQETIVPYGTDKPGVLAYLQRLYDNREHWAWPWVGSTFTAGVQSTSRVEGIHSIIKAQANSKTPLPRLVALIQQKLTDEVLTTRLLHYKAQLRGVPRANTFEHRMFALVERENTSFLGLAACYQMTLEIIESSYYRHEEVNFDGPGDQGDLLSSDQASDAEEVSAEFIIVLNF